jgi:hypothetical protein
MKVVLHSHRIYFYLLRRSGFFCLSCFVSLLRFYTFFAFILLSLSLSLSLSLHLSRPSGTFPVIQILHVPTYSYIPNGPRSLHETLKVETKEAREPAPVYMSGIMLTDTLFQSPSLV